MIRSRCGCAEIEAAAALLSATRLRCRAGVDRNDGGEERHYLDALTLTVISAVGDASWQLPAGTHLVGRDPHCDIAIDDPTVSRQHAKLEVTSESTRLVDLGSKNGTFVNGARVSDAQLIRSGDLLGFGKVIAVLGSSPPAAAPQAMATAAADWTLIDSRTRSFDSVDVRGLLQERTEVLQRLLEAFGGLTAIIRQELRNENELESYLTRLASVVGAGEAWAVEFDDAGERWRLLARSNRLESGVVAVSEKPDQQLQQAFRAQEIAVTRLVGDAEATPKMSIAVPVTSDGERIGVLYLAGLRVAEGEINSRLELAQLGADIMALKLRGLRQRESELAVAAAAVRLRESESNREALLRAHQLLQEQHEELLEANKLAALGKLAAGIVHELNTPIAVARSSSQTIASFVKREVDAAKAGAAAGIRANLEALNAATQRIGEVIAALKTFALIDRPEVMPLEVNACMDATIELLKPRFPATIRLVRRYGDIGPVTCSGRELNQVLLAVLENAFQAVAETGEVALTTSSSEEAVTIEIADNGRGIAADRLEHIFEPNFVIKAGRVRLGLGLSAAKRVLLEMNGQIAVRSELGKGTTVTIRVPKVAATGGEPE